MKKYIASAFLIMAATTANAADITSADDVPVINAPEASVPEPMSARWGGAYLGVSLGYSYLTDTAPAIGKGTIYGGHAGYNAQWGQFVAGVDVSANNADILFNDGTGIKSKFIYGARVRAGWANDLFFAYGSLGAEHGVTNLPTPFSKDTTLQFGAGVDVAFTKNISLGLDVTHAKYKKFANFTFGGNKIDVNSTKVQARLSYTFN